MLWVVQQHFQEYLNDPSITKVGAVASAPSGGFFSNLKNQIITGAGAILATIGTVFIDEIKSIVGIEDETEQAAGTQQNNQQIY